VGTPGRLCALLEAGKLPVAAMRLLVLDEADSLLAESFIDDIDWLKQRLPSAQLQVGHLTPLPNATIARNTMFSFNYQYFHN
jgi:superfamily II DNA/RNA helicase